MEQQNIPWGPVAVAALAVVLLNMIGMVWIGVSQERSRADIARLGQQFREIPAAPAQPDASPELAAIQKRLDTLATKLDSLAPNAEDAKAVAQTIQDRFGTPTVHINYIGPVIGSHTGPNTMGIFFVGTQR